MENDSLGKDQIWREEYKAENSRSEVVCVWCVGDKGMTKRGGVHVIVVVNLV